MSLNCLTCQRTNSLRGGFDGAAINGEKPRSGLSLRRQQVDRSWSGNLVPRPVAATTAAPSNLGLPQKVVEGSGVPQRRHSGPVECDTPRLVRSCGMRRDWSFEDLRQKVKA